MKAVILAGGYGTRLAEETGIKPKPMVEIGGKPILWHIMKIYAHHGINEFIVLCGYKGHVIKEYFSNYFLHQSSISIDLKNNQVEVVDSEVEPWKVTLLDTGIDTMTGGRILQARKVLNNEPFLLTYGDGVGDINIKDLINHHQNKARSITMTAVQPEGRYGALDFDDDDNVLSFKEKPKGDKGWINGGFFVCEPEVFDYITEGSQTVFERNPLENLAKDGKMNCYRHNGFWKCMDTLADRNALDKLLVNNEAKWKVWE